MKLYMNLYVGSSSNKSSETSWHKPQMAPNEKVSFHEKLGLRSKTPSSSPWFHHRIQLFEENLIERGSMYGHFAFSGSPWGAIRGRLLKKEFSKQQSRLSEKLTCLLLESEFERFLKYVCNCVIISAWNLDGKCCQGLN